jgi:hypothetical protein
MRTRLPELLTAAGTAGIETFDAVSSVLETDHGEGPFRSGLLVGWT